MKLITSLTLGFLASTSLFAQTTMCFKENHKSMTTIENTKLDGGECKGLNTVKDMKKNGWNTDDIKITSTSTGHNYIYIFKKENLSLSLNEEQLEQRIMQRLQKRDEEEKAARIVMVKERMSKDGKKLYINKCQKCHGEKANKRAYATSRPLVDLTLDDMQLSIRDYSNQDYDRGNAFVMRPYANILTSKRVKNIYSYIKTLKPKKEKKEESK